jgi:membrane-associated protease RseP (regulator of RpoE activity)
MKRQTNLSFWLATLTAGALLIPMASGQVLPKNRQGGGNAAPGPVPAQPAAPAAGETAGQTRREGRQDARESRAEAKNAGETRPQARETARETRQETRQNIQGTMPANLGVTFNNAAANGLVVSNLTTNSALATAGLRSGDQIVSLNGQPVTTQAQFYQYLTGPNLGTQQLPLIVMRNGQRQTLNLQPSAFAATDDGSVRTALRPNIDAGAGVNAQGGASATAPSINATAPGINATAPGANIGTQATPATPSTQSAPAAPANSVTPQAGTSGPATGSANIGGTSASGSANGGASTSGGTTASGSASAGAPK